MSLGLIINSSRYRLVHYIENRAMLYRRLGSPGSVSSTGRRSNFSSPLPIVSAYLFVENFRASSPSGKNRTKALPAYRFMC